MKISCMFGYTISAIWWLLVILIQLSVPLTIYLGLTEDSRFLILTVILFLLAAVVTVWCGGLNTVPSILWRFRKNLQTRIVEVGGYYALQIKVLGGWIYVDASEGETGAVMTAWIDDLSAYTFLLNKRSQAEKYLVRLQEDIASGLKPTVHPPEVIATQTISRGNIVKPK